MSQAADAQASTKRLTDLQTLVSLCKRRGFVFQSSEIYGGLGLLEWFLAQTGTVAGRSVQSEEEDAITPEIIEKVETYELKRNVLLPKFDIPKEFTSEDEYLHHLTYLGAKRRYPEITPEITERIDFELETIKKTGYPGYFLIVQDFTNKAKELGVAVGPGRGSHEGIEVAAAGHVVQHDCRE